MPFLALSISKKKLEVPSRDSGSLSLDSQVVGGVGALAPDPNVWHCAGTRWMLSANVCCFLLNFHLK